MIDAIQFSSFSEFIDMGGYAFNVWTVYALFAVFLVANIMLPLRKHKQILREQSRRRSINDEIKNSKKEDDGPELGT